MTTAQTLLALAGLALVGGAACFQRGDRLLLSYRYAVAYRWITVGAFCTGVMGTALVAAALLLVG